MCSRYPDVVCGQLVFECYIVAASNMNASEIDVAVQEIVGSTLFIDIYTHLFDPSFGSLSLWGIDAPRERTAPPHTDAPFGRTEELVGTAVLLSSDAASFLPANPLRLTEDTLHRE